MAGTESLRPVPDNLITEILLRSSAKPLLRFKSVCKLWYSTISSPRFANLHLHHESNRPRLLLCHYGFEPTRQPCDDQDFEMRDLAELALSFGYGIRSLHGPCDGIFCLIGAGRRFALWNPATRQLKLVPDLPRGLLRSVAFGTDIVTGEFKIVVILSRKKQIAIYTSGLDAWRYLDKERFPDHVHLELDGPGLFLNGFCYWIVPKPERGYRILAFDMHNEAFVQEIDFPYQHKRDMVLYVYENSLAVACKWPEGGFWVWVLNENWSKQFFVPSRFDFFDPVSNDGMRVRKWRKLLGFWKRKGVVYVRERPGGAGYVFLSEGDHPYNFLRIEPISRSIENNPSFVPAFVPCAFTYKENLNSI